MAIDPDLLLILTGNEIGDGPADLGERLAGLFLGVLAKSETRPARILFLNSAIFLTTEGTPVKAELDRLLAGGTDLVSCITCLTYYDRMARIVTGRAGDMKGTVADLTSFRKVVTL